jgi:hypothetical protein
MVFTSRHGLPIRKSQTGYIARPRLNPALVFDRVGADDFEPQDVDPDAPSNVLPPIPRCFPVVHAISDHVTP